MHILIVILEHRHLVPLLQGQFKVVSVKQVVSGFVVDFQIGDVYIEIVGPASRFYLIIDKLSKG